MIRSRLALSLAAALVGLGLATALGVLVLAPARAAVGPLPVEGLVLPSGARFLMGVDVKRLVQSPLYARFAKGPGGMRPDAFKSLEERTGLNPERDVRELVVAGIARLQAGGLAGIVDVDLVCLLVRHQVDAGQIEEARLAEIDEGEHLSQDFDLPRHLPSRIGWRQL